MPPSLTRSRRYGVGKDIAGAVYVHRQYEEVFGDVVLEAKRHLPKSYEYQVVKYDARTGNVSFVESKDFDSTDEPTVGEVVIVRKDTTTRHQRRLDDPPIYHHKWMFVRDDYRGFDVEASKRRSKQWLSLANVDRSRIGRLSYWRSQVIPRLSEADGKDS